LRCIICEISIFDSKQWWSEFIRAGEDKDTRRILNDFLYELHFVDGLDTRLHETGSFGVESELVDELLHVIEFHLLTVELFSLSFSVFNSDFFKSVIVSLVVIKLLLIEMNDFITGDVQELSSVGDDNDSVFAVSDVVFEPHDSVEI
jgi:hypothetical protein